MAPSSGWAATTSARPNSPTQTSSISTAASSRPPSSTAMCTSPRRVSRSSASICGRPPRRGTACNSWPNTRSGIPTDRSGGTAGTSRAGPSNPAEHRRPRRRGRVTDRPTWPVSTSTRRGVHGTTAARPGPAAAQGSKPQRPLTADAHHLVRAAARDRLTPEQRARARAAALDLAAANGIVAVHECAGPDIGGLDDWRELRAPPRRRDRRVLGRSGHQREAGRVPVETTGARGLAGDLFVDGASAREPPGCTSPTPTRRTAAATPTSKRQPSPRICAPAPKRGITAGFHVIGDAAVTAVVDALQPVVDQLGAQAVARCGHRLEHLEMVTAEQAARLGAWGVIASVQPNFDALWGGETGCMRSVWAPTERRPAQPARAVSIPRRAPRLRLRFPGHRHESVGDDARGDPAPDTRQRGLDARGVLRGDPRRLARGRGARRRHRHAGSRRARLLCGVGGRRARGQRAGRCRATLVDRPALAGARPATARPDDGCRDACRPSTEVSSSMADAGRRRRERPKHPTDRQPANGPARRRAAASVSPVARLACGVAMTRARRRLLLCLSFPPFGWWLPRRRVRPAGLGADPRDGQARGGFGYGFLFGRRSTSRCCRGPGLVGWCRGWRSRVVRGGVSRRVRRARVAVRSCPAGRSGSPRCGRAEWAKSTVPFGGFPWGVSRSVKPTARFCRWRLGGAPLVVRGRADRIQPGCPGSGHRAWWRARPPPPTAPAPWCCPGFASASCCSPSRPWPQVRQSGADAGDDPSIMVAAVQGNVPRLGLDFNAQRRAVFDNHVARNRGARRRRAPGAAPQPTS